MPWVRALIFIFPKRFSVHFGRSFREANKPLPHKVQRLTSGGNDNETSLVGGLERDFIFHNILDNSGYISITQLYMELRWLVVWNMNFIFDFIYGIIAVISVEPSCIWNYCWLVVWNMNFIFHNILDNSGYISITQLYMELLLIGGLEHECYFRFHIWDVIPTPLTNSIIFQRGRSTTRSKLGNSKGATWQLFDRSMLRPSLQLAGRHEPRLVCLERHEWQRRREPWNISVFHHGQYSKSTPKTHTYRIFKWGVLPTGQ